MKHKIAEFKDSRSIRIVRKNSSVERAMERWRKTHSDDRRDTIKGYNRNVTRYTAQRQIS